MRRLLLVALTAGLLAACSGGGAGSNPPTPGPTPTRGPVTETDVAYMRTVCRAFNTYLTTFNAETQRDPALFSDQKRLLRVAAPILKTFSTNLEKAKPPKDVANFHKALVERVGTIAAKAKAGLLVETGELDRITKGHPLPPATVRDRLAEASGTLPECATSGGTDALFGDTGI